MNGLVGGYIDGGFWDKIESWVLRLGKRGWAYFLDTRFFLFLEACSRTTEYRVSKESSTFLFR